MNSKKKKENDFLIIKDCDLVPPEVFCFYLRPIFEFPPNLNLFYKINSNINLWYEERNFYFSKLKIVMMKNNRGDSKNIFNVTEPRIKNVFLFFDSVSKKKSKRYLSSVFDLDSKQHFTGKQSILNHLKKANLFSDINISTKPMNLGNNIHFLDLKIILREKMLLSYKPHLNFDGNDFNSSILIKKKNFLGKTADLKGKFEFCKNLYLNKTKNLLVESEISNLIKSVKFGFSFQKKNEKEWLGKIDLTTDVNPNDRKKAEFVYEKKNAYNRMLVKGLNFNYLTRFIMDVRDILIIKAQLNIFSYYNSMHLKELEIKIENSFEIPCFTNRIPNFFLKNGIFVGYDKEAANYFYQKFPGFHVLDYSFLLKKYGKIVCNRTSFYLEKNFEKQDFSFCIFSNAFSGRKKERIFKGVLCGVKFNFKNLFTFFFWKNKKKKRGLQIFYQNSLGTKKKI